MHNRNWLYRVFIFAVFSTSLLGSSPALANNYKMTGILTAVNLSARVVVIEVKRNRDRFTIAGPLASNAKLFKFSRFVRLEDFKIGKSVDVEWHRTVNGHVIDRLIQ